MNFKQDIIAHTFRNKYLKYTGGSYTTSKASSTTDYTATQIANWFYEDDNGNLHSRLSFVGDKEISAYGVGDDSGTGSVTIIDNLLSNAADCALSANQGRVLNEKIEDIIEQGVGGVTSWDDLEDKPALLTDSNIQKWNTQSHTHSNKTVLDGITSDNISNWNTAYTNNHTHSNKTVLDTITSTKVSNWDGVVTNWNKAFYFDSDDNLRVKLNLVGEGEVSAYGTSTGGTGIITIVDNLTSTATDCALSANQGRVLKNLIDSKVSEVSWNDIKDKPSTFTPSTHTHNYASTVKVGSTSYNVSSNIISLPAYPTSLKNPNALTISLNGTSQGAYDGSAAKSINITASSVGAAASSHTHTISQITDRTGLLTALSSSSATNLSITVGGTTKSIADLYATTAEKLSTNAGSATRPIYFSNGIPVAGTYIFGNAGDNAAINNGILCRNLNADMLDGYHLKYDWASSNKTCVKLFTIKILSSYTNTPVEFRINGRSGGDALISVKFDNYNGTDPGLISFTGYGIYSGYIDRLKIYKSATSTWEIWLTSQTQAYDSGKIYAVYIPSGFSFTIDNSASDTLPSYSTSYTCSKANVYGNILGNSSTATQLQTSRTIWGQSFNGTGNVNGRFELDGAYRGVLSIFDNTSYVSIQSYKSMPLVFNQEGNNVGIGTSSPSQKLHVNGNILATGEITAYSDARLKTNIQTLEDRGYITPVTYEKDGKQSIGFLAQDVQKLYPELVTEDTNEEKYLSLNYAQYTAVLQAQIIQLNMRIKQLESKL